MPWVAAQRSPEQDLDGDPTERFSQSVRILRQDVLDYRPDDDECEVSTPLTRRAGLTELTMIAKQAARRRLVVMGTLALALIVVLITSIAGVTPWWSLAIPGGLLVAFVIVARFSVVAMHRNLHARAEALERGFDDQENTGVIDLADDEASESIEISVDLTVPPSMGALWDPVPVASASYVSQPLLPRTVRTIDLSAPVTPSSPVVPTADNPASKVDEAREANRAVDEAPTEVNIAEFRPRAVGE